MTVTTRKRITAREFRTMAEAGIFAEARLELLDGELIEMTPIGPEHAHAVRQLIALLSTMSPERGALDVQNPLLMPGDNEFYPDVMVLKPREGGYRSLPLAPDALLVVEVAKTSLLYDREVKRTKYQGAGVPMYWVADIDAKQLWTYAEPGQRGYDHEHRAGQDETLEVLGVSVPVARLF
ncbi:MAG: Uma2 family endonuclease [Deinococcota bacterium]|nr:Uma2 family endonuclease [Deinococcota bacterium]